MSGDAAGEFASVADQFVRQYLEGKKSDNSYVGLDPAVDRLVLAVSDQAPNTVKQDLREVLERNATGAATALPQRLETALKTWSARLEAAWRKHKGAPPDTKESEKILKLCRVVVFDSAQQGLALEILREAVVVPGEEGSLLTVLNQWASNGAASGTGGDAATLRAYCTRHVRLAVPADYRSDVARLKVYSEATQTRLRRFRSLRTPDGDVVMNRAVTESVIGASSAQSFLVTGEPGAGKSAVLHAAAERLAADFPVLVFSVDAVATSLNALRGEIGLEHPIEDVLRAFADTRC